MDKAIAIVKAMVEKVDGKLNEVRDKYSYTNPCNIYDASYRKFLEEMEDRLIRESNTLRDVIIALNGARGDE